MSLIKVIVDLELSFGLSRVELHKIRKQAIDLIIIIKWTFLFASAHGIELNLVGTKIGKLYFRYINFGGLEC